MNDLYNSMDDRMPWRRVQTSLTSYDDQTPSSWLRVSDFINERSERKEGRLPITNIRREKDCDVTIRWSASSAARDVRRTSQILQAVSSRQGSKTNDRCQREGRRRRSGVSSPYRQGVSMLIGILCLVELARRSTVWYILVWIYAAGWTFKNCRCIAV